MAEKKYVVPAGMLKAAEYRYRSIENYIPAHATNTHFLKLIEECLEAALRWLSENPIVPTEKQWEEISKDAPLTSIRMPYDWVLSEWQRRMFLAPEPDHVDGTVEYRYGTDIPIGIWYKGNLLPTNFSSVSPKTAPSPEPEVPCVLRSAGEFKINMTTGMILCPAHPSGHDVDEVKKKIKDSGGFVIGEMDEPEPPVDPLVMYIERHFEDSYADKRSLRNRAEATVGDYKEHLKRNCLKIESFDIFDKVRDNDSDGTIEYMTDTTRPVAIWWEGTRWPIATISRHEDMPMASDVKFQTGVYVSPKSNDFPVAGFTEPEYPAEIKDYMAWAEVYFGGHPQLRELKNVLSGAYRRGQKSAAK
jgi:hypothetical protein